MEPAFILENPNALWLLLLLAPWLFYQKKMSRRANSKLLFPGEVVPSGTPSSWRLRLLGLPLVFRLLALITMVLMLARPQWSGAFFPRNQAGVDLLFALDLSFSMSSEDLSPNRLTVAKENIKRFVSERPSDRMGLVVFGREAYLSSPLTFSRKLLADFVGRVTFQDGLSTQTALGLGIATAVQALKNSRAKSKVVILVTDGENTSGTLAPLTAAQLARAYEIKIYTIGIGEPGRSQVLRTVENPLLGKHKAVYETAMNEALLKTLSELTGGSYFNARDEAGLEKSYAAIDALEKTTLPALRRIALREFYPLLALLALGFLVAEWGLKEILLRRFP